MRRSDGCICPKGAIVHIPDCHPRLFGGQSLEGDVARALEVVIRLAVTHLLSHEHDEHNLSLAIELLKTIRDEPHRIQTMLDRWGLEPGAPA